MLIIACMMMLKGETIYMTGKVVRETPVIYTISTTEGFYDFPKEDCITKPYRPKR